MISICLVLIFIGTALTLTVDWRVKRLGGDAILTVDQLSGSTFDCVIVPGASVLPSGVPSLILQDRLDMAVEIFRSGLTDRILVSGDHGAVDYNEVGAMRDYLLDAGIPPAAIFMDHAGFDTYDTLYRARSVFEVEHALITTQDFQLVRALYIADRLGFDVLGVDCGYVKYAEKLRNRLREYPARVKAWLDAELLKVSPTYEGPTIPIEGDGRASWDDFTDSQTIG